MKERIFKFIKKHLYLLSLFAGYLAVAWIVADNKTDFAVFVSVGAFYSMLTNAWDIGRLESKQKESEE